MAVLGRGTIFGIALSSSGFDVESGPWDASWRGCPVRLMPGKPESPDRAYPCIGRSSGGHSMTGSFARLEILEYL
jgi:hypothetical protein